MMTNRNDEPMIRRTVMKFSNTILKVVAAFVAVSIIQVLAGAVAGLLLPFPAGTPHALPHFVAWMLLSNLVTAAALSILGLRSDWRGWTLGAALAAIPLAITVINGIEGVIFLPHSPIPWPSIFLQSAIAAAISVPVWMLLFGRRPAVTEANYHPIAAKSRPERAWKFAVSDLAYLVCYLTAGSIIFPYVKDFYATQSLPSMSGVFELELLLRGPVFVVLCLLLVRMLGLPRLNGAVMVGLLFTLLGGIALVIPNPYFPDAVRWTHFCEVTSSNFVFGAIVAWLWGQPQLPQTQVLRRAA